MILLQDADATYQFGRRIAELLQAGDVVTLDGPLGAGKTSLARGILAGLGLLGEAPSPSFAIVQSYAPPEVRIPVLHVDLYRLEDASELRELGLDEASGDPAMLIEWPDRAGPDAWPEALHLRIAPDPSGGRCLTPIISPRWENRWQT